MATAQRVSGKHREILFVQFYQIWVNPTKRIRYLTSREKFRLDEEIYFFSLQRWNQGWRNLSNCLNQRFGLKTLLTNLLGRLAGFITNICTVVKKNLLFEYPCPSLHSDLCLSGHIRLLQLIKIMPSIGFEPPHSILQVKRHNRLAIKAKKFSFFLSHFVLLCEKLCIKKFMCLHVWINMHATQWFIIKPLHTSNDCKAARHSTWQYGSLPVTSR